MTRSIFPNRALHADGNRQSCRRRIRSKRRCRLWGRWLKHRSETVIREILVYIPNSGIALFIRQHSRVRHRYTHQAWIKQTLDNGGANVRIPVGRWIYVIREHGVTRKQYDSSAIW